MPCRHAKAPNFSQSMGAFAVLALHTAHQQVQADLSLESLMIDETDSETGIGSVATEQIDPVDLGAAGASGQNEGVDRMLTISGIEYGCAGAFFDDFKGDSRAPDGLYREAIGRAP